MVGLGRVELPTSPLSGVRSSQLSYRPIPSFKFQVSSFERGPSRQVETRNSKLEPSGTRNCLYFEDKVERAYGLGPYGPSCRSRPKRSSSEAPESPIRDGPYGVHGNLIFLVLEED